MTTRSRGKAVAGVEAVAEMAAGVEAVAAVARLRVDWPACMARGLCSELLPELVGLDEWGYPVVTGEVPAALLHLAKEAVVACPERALRLLER